MIEVCCPNCKRMYHFPNGLRGKTGDCIACRHKFVMPQPIRWKNYSRNDKPTDISRTEISQINPTCVIFLVDQSGSMNNHFALAGSRKDCVAKTIDRFLYNMIIRCTTEKGIRDYFYVALYGYGGECQITDVFGSVKPISWVAEHTKRLEKRKVYQRDGAGDTIELETEFPVWLDPKAEGNTPMTAAFQRAYSDLRQWVSKYPHSFPPIVFNITDGDYTDENPQQTVDKIMSLKTKPGNVMAMNCHISGGTQPVFFPNNQKMNDKDGLDRQLYEISSVLPASMIKEGNKKGYKIEEGARGFTFNADLVMLIDFLDLGSQPVWEIDLVAPDFSQTVDLSSPDSQKDLSSPDFQEVELIPPDMGSHEVIELIPPDSKIEDE